MCFFFLIPDVVLRLTGGQEQDHGRKVTEENEKLLLEKRELLQRVTEAEEMGSNGLRTATTIQQRCVCVCVCVCVCARIVFQLFFLPVNDPHLSG